MLWMVERKLRRPLLLATFLTKRWSELRVPSVKPSLGCIALTATTGTTVTGHNSVSVQRASSGSLAMFAAILCTRSWLTRC